MNKKHFLNTVKKARESSKKRNFIQSVDFLISFKNVDLKKAEDRISLIVKLPHGKQKKPKVCAFVDKSMIVEARKVFDHAILDEKLSEVTPKEAKRIASSYDYFVAAGSLMTKVASSFGKFLAPKGKMPDPKFGAVLPPKADLQQIKDNFSKLVKIDLKKAPVVHTFIGVETMSDEELADNAFTIYNEVKKALPRGDQQIKKVFLKLTMGKPIKVEENEKSDSK
jgi:large subunit ribosomal protein L1